jgi:hypothetical protein
MVKSPPRARKRKTRKRKRTYPLTVRSGHGQNIVQERAFLQREEVGKKSETLKESKRKILCDCSSSGNSCCLFAVAAVARRTESVGERVGCSRRTFRRDSMTRDSGEREREREGEVRHCCTLAFMSEAFGPGLEGSLDRDCRASRDDAVRMMANRWLVGGKLV